MKLTDPIIITPYLLPGVEIGSAFISIEYSPRAGRGGRTRYAYHIDLPNKSEHTGDDLQSGAGGGGLQDGLESLLSFLSACGESVNYAQRTGRGGENAELFPTPVAEWAAAHTDELTLLEMELQETPGLIEE